MSQNDPAAYIPPDEKTPRIYGTLNIIFGALLLLCNLIQGGFYVASPVLKRAADSWQVQLNASVQAGHESRLADMKTRVAVAKTPGEKAQAQADLDKFLSQPKPEIATMSMGFSAMEDRRILSYGVAEMLTGFILNTLMIVSGVALLSYKAWGRKWAVAIAGIKLARLAILLCVSIAVIIPIQVDAMQPQVDKAKGQIAAPGGGANPALAMMTPQAMSAMSTAGVVLNTLVAAVYPTLVLVMLTRPRVKAACIARKSREPETLA